MWTAKPVERVIEFYAQIKFVHVLCVVLSGSLFAMRGVMMLANSARVDHWALRFASYAIDTTLLTAALMLMAILHQYPIAQPWLTTKVALLIVYVALGTLALRRGGTRGVRGVCLLLALAVLLFMAGIAHTHSPAGPLALLGIGHR